MVQSLRRLGGRLDRAGACWIAGTQCAAATSACLPLTTPDADLRRSGLNGRPRRRTDGSLDWPTLDCTPTGTWRPPRPGGCAPTCPRPCRLARHRRRRTRPPRCARSRTRPGPPCTTSNRVTGPRRPPRPREPVDRPRSMLARADRAFAARWLRLEPIRMGAHSSLGSVSTVMAGAEIGEGATVADKSLVHTGARIPAGEHGAGSPIARQPSVPPLLVDWADHTRPSPVTVPVLAGYLKPGEWTPTVVRLTGRGRPKQPRGRRRRAGRRCFRVDRPQLGLGPR
jgi:hypothetical protein